MQSCTLGSLLCAAAVTACNTAPIPSNTADVDINVGVDDAAIMSTLAGHRDSPAFVRLNDAPYPTALGTGADINVYVSANAYVPYASITPETSGSNITVPEGTLIVREVLEDSGAIKTLTLMYKGPTGYNPELGDFWFGVTDAEGTPVLDAAGAAKIGKLSECYGCHIPRASDGYLFGVPANVRPVLTDPTEPVPPTPPPVMPLPPPPAPTPDPVCGDFACNGDETCETCAYDCVCANELSSDLDLNGEQLSLTSCRNGLVFGFRGVQLTAEGGTRVRIGASQAGEAADVAVAPPGSDRATRVAGCAVLDIADQSSTINGVTNVAGNATLDCSGSSFLLTGQVSFSNCH